MVAKVLVVLLLLIAIPAQAHSVEEQAEWEAEWKSRVAATSLTVELLAEYQDFQARHVIQPTSSNAVVLQGNVAHPWWSLVAIHFPADQIPTALRIIDCESAGDPNAHNPSGASGLFQVMPFWADYFGYARSDLFAANLNVEIARKVWDAQGWGAWSCY